MALKSVERFIGRYVGIGTRCRFSKVGAPTRWIELGTIINILLFDSEDYLRLEFAPARNTLVIKSRYSFVVASNNINIQF